MTQNKVDKIGPAPRVAVEHAGAMNAIQRLRNRDRDLQGILRREWCAHAAPQISPAKVFHDEIRVAVAHA